MTKEEKSKHTFDTMADAFDESEKMFHELFEIAPQGLTILDPETFCFTRCNSNALDLFKYSAAEISKIGPGQVSPEFQPDGRRSDEKAKEYIERALKGEKLVFEWVIIDGQGNSFIAEVRLVSISNDSKPLVYASFNDITERKRIEEKIELQNKKLYEIAYLQSHQVRAPVASILGLVSLFNFKDLNDPLNAELLLKVGVATHEFDKIIKEITLKTSMIKDHF
ncbi:MAG: PAS domain S-box protein [Bacteroidota bacterium]|nr:PAS domain S-box protein [Bacteroidota bacterium]